MNSRTLRRGATLLLIMVCMLLPVLSFTGCASEEAEKSGGSTKSEVFASWDQDSKTLNDLITYVKDVTNEDSKNYIPVEDRIAVFDMDGTLYSELAPTYFEWSMYAYRVNEDSSFQPDWAEKNIADQIVEVEKGGTPSDDLESEQGTQNARVYAGMTVAGYKEYVREYAKHDVVGFEGMTYKEAFYKPMIEVVKYLNANKFSVYICSGSDRFLCRELTDGIIPISDDHIIGSDVALVARNQGDKDGLDYVYQNDDEVVRTDETLVKNVKMNKVEQLARELGQQPVICFGNSTGDESMGVYTTENNKYKSKAFMVVADDTERDYGDEAKAAERKALWDSHGWDTISMKNDFKTIYGDKVKKTSK